MIANQTNPTILLVDDDSQVRRLCRLLLERSGYCVLDADSANMAEKIWQANSPTISLLVTDYDMPGGNGLQLSATLRSSNPALPVVLISGNLIHSVPESVRFIQKPFSPGAFIETVMECVPPSHLR